MNEMKIAREIREGGGSAGKREGTIVSRRIYVS